jgi:hypothetical protein
MPPRYIPKSYSKPDGAYTVKRERALEILQVTDSELDRIIITKDLPPPSINNGQERFHIGELSDYQAARRAGKV